MPASLPDRSTPLFFLVLLSFLGSFVLTYASAPEMTPCTPVASFKWEVHCLENSALLHSAPTQRTPENSQINLGARAWLFQQPMNLNLARRHELRLLPGLGRNVVNRIQKHHKEHGDFQSVAALRKVKGIGKKTVQKLSPFLTVEPISFLNDHPTKWAQKNSNLRPRPAGQKASASQIQTAEIRTADVQHP